MKPIFRKSAIVALAAALILGGMACSFGDLLPFLGGQATATPTPATAVLVPGSNSTSMPIPSPSASPAQGASGSTTPQSADVMTGLDNVDSYRMVFDLKLTGKGPDGKEAAQELHMTQERIKSKESLHLVMTTSGTGGATPSGNFEVFQIGKTGYLLSVDKSSSKTSCLSFSGDKPAFDQSQIITPEEMLGNVQKDSLVARGETVNGVKTDHYKIKRTDMNFGKVTTETGDIWIAQDGGYVVRLKSQMQGEFTFAASQVTGTAIVAYDLQEINKMTSIALPAECKAAEEFVKDIPIPANATEKSSLGDLLTFSSPDSSKAVADYYRKVLPGLGWKITNDTAMDTIVILAIQKDPLKYQIMITPGKDDVGSSVVITKAQ